MGNKGKGRLIKWIIVLGDFICINISFALSYFILPDDVIGSFDWRIGWLLLNISYLPVVYAFGEVYNERITYIDLLLSKTLKSLVVFVLIFLSLAMFFNLEVGTKVQLFNFVSFFILLNSWWFIANKTIRHYRKKGYNFKRVVIVGARQTGQILYKELQSNAGYGYCFLGFFDSEKPQEPKIEALYKGDISEVEKFCIDNKVDELYCALPSSEDVHIVNMLQMSERNTIRFFIVPEVRRFVTRTLSFGNIGAVPLLSVREEPLQRWLARFVKRSIDLFLSGIVILFSPLWFLPIAIAVKKSSPGPVLFRQKRTGYMGRDFDCLKFRTMRINKDSDTKQAERGDARITKVGAFLRKTSLDEFPQFFNVFLGDMSLVGPRPHMLKHTEDYSKLIDKYMVRHFIKPGITGWAQVNGYRGETKTLQQMEKRVEYDVWYLEHWNIFLDIKIIILTVFGVFKGDDNAF
ncbi:MAG: undecaprenyl-phosphate glucose phosphotransferase [Bacteroidales bacterium]|nr:undecaprenyl-phosphate glucose phosphotransferase [Bacteroidales bacterium]MBR5531735.1 undecaprenyl-phosphate glucose phosphotransferase [Bacteroidales bacterium]